jgi:hypothetical protein
MFLTGSHILSLSGYPFHLIRYWSLHQLCQWAQMASTSYCSSPLITSGGGLEVVLAMFHGSNVGRKEAWKMGWMFH